MNFEDMSNKGLAIAAFLSQFKPDILTVISELPFQDWQNAYQSVEEQGIAIGKEEKESLIRIMEPLAKAPEEKEFIKKMKQSLQGG